MRIRNARAAIINELANRGINQPHRDGLSGLSDLARRLGLTCRLRKRTILMRA
ncbi:hypothetical protein BDZ91DRAFT_742122 [Kalaharituber pfeilii]|nr:hypothetical protein BDZ91DRAFT_742122 [Kalaharituber pfeilii]